MKLYIKYAGELHEVEDDLEQYDLSKPFDQSVIIDSLMGMIKFLQDSGE